MVPPGCSGWGITAGKGGGLLEPDKVPDGGLPLRALTLVMEALRMVTV